MDHFFPKLRVSPPFFAVGWGTSWKYGINSHSFAEVLSKVFSFPLKSPELKKTCLDENRYVGCLLVA